MQRTFHYSLESTNCTDSLFRYASCRHLCPRCLKPVLVALQLKGFYFPSFLPENHPAAVRLGLSSGARLSAMFASRYPLKRVSKLAVLPTGDAAGGFRAIGAGASKRLESRDLELKLIVWPLPTFIWSKWWPLPSVFEIHILDLWGRERWNATKCPDVGLPLKLNQYHDAHWWIGGTQWNFSIICKPAARVSGRRCIYPIQSDQPAAYCCLVSRSPMFWYFSVRGVVERFLHRYHMILNLCHCCLQYHDLSARILVAVHSAMWCAGLLWRLLGAGAEGWNGSHCQHTRRA